MTASAETPNSAASGAISDAAPLLRPPAVWRLAWVQLLRDWRSGELRLLVTALVLAVGALSSVGFFAGRLGDGLALNARQLLGGDAVIASDQPAPAELRQLAERLGMKTVQTATFPSMARASDAQGGASRLVAVKAVGEAYPLRGQVTLKDEAMGSARPAGSAPKQGHVWVDAGVLSSLNLSLGDALLLGDSTFQIDAVVGVESDRGAGFMTFAPRVMMHEADLPATGLIQPASRVRYRLAVASPSDDLVQVGRFVQKAEEAIALRGFRGMQVESLQSGRPEMRQTLDRAEKFLTLVALLAALLAAVAIGIATRDFAQRRLDACAMLRVLGQSQRRMAGQFALEFLALGLIASVAGVVVGWSLHWVFVWLLSGLLETQLPAASVVPGLWGIGVGLTLLMAFGLPPVLQLAQVPALRVIRRDVGNLRASSLTVLAAGSLGFAGLLFGVAKDPKMALIACAGFVAAMALFAACGALAVWGLRRVVPKAQAPRWMILATRQVAARPAFAVLQVSALGVGLMALILLVLLRTDLVESWRQATPPNAPNRFVINIQPDQAEPLQQRLHRAGVDKFDWYPMIRGRLVAINDRSVTVGEQSSERAQRLVDREFNLSHSAALPENNELVAGQWVPNEPDGLSVEQGLAQTLGLKLGDRLSFDIAGQSVVGRITSLRKVDWGSMRVNFFVLFPQAQMPQLPQTQIAAFRSPEALPGAPIEANPAHPDQAAASQPKRTGQTPARSAAAQLDDALSREFPNITTVDVSASIAQVQSVLDQVVRAVEFLFGFTLAAGLVVLFAAVTATREARAHEFAVMRALGASAQLLRQVQRAELLGVGALAGLLAALGASAVAWALARFAFEFSWAPSWSLPLTGAVLGAALAWMAGWWGLREVLQRPVVQTLRSASRE